jgi:hypothetical protein
VTTPAESLLHEIRNALLPLAYDLQRGTATLEDAARVTKRLLDFADEVAREVRQPTQDADIGQRAVLVHQLREQAAMFANDRFGTRSLLLAAAAEIAGPT